MMKKETFLQHSHKMLVKFFRVMLQPTYVVPCFIYFNYKITLQMFKLTPFLSPLVAGFEPTTSLLLNEYFTTVLTQMTKTKKSLKRENNLKINIDQLFIFISGKRRERKK